MGSVKMTKQFITLSVLACAVYFVILSRKNTNLLHPVQIVAHTRNFVNVLHNRTFQPQDMENNGLVKNNGTTLIDNGSKENQRKIMERQLLTADSYSDRFPSFERLMTYFKYENVTFETYQLDAHLGQVLPLVRELPDTRPELCQKIPYDRSLNLHKVSIIIPFYDELWSVLLRTIHSVIARSPEELLMEIILVDDNSSKENLKTPLENYIQWLPKIRLLRNKEREGLIRARMIGARQAKGDILIFLDAHVEVNKGWLEPLVAEIAQDRTRIAVPYVAQIEPFKLVYSVPGYPLYRMKGTFTWELDYLWSAHKTPEHASHLPYSTSTIIGCGLAVHKKYFFEIGGFDEGLKIWGGENLEISFRTWQCGGSIAIVPCSVLGHVFRSHLPYACTDDVVMANLQRVAEVWMDEYKQLFYRTVPSPPHPISYGNESFLKERNALRKALNCKSFSWYLQYVATDVTVPKHDSYFFGQIKTLMFEMSMCAFVEQTNHISFESCFFVSTNHFFAFTVNNTLVSAQNNYCLTMTTDSMGLVEMKVCDYSIFQKWVYRQSQVPDHIRKKLLGVDIRKPVGRFASVTDNFDLCLSVGDYFSVQTILVKQCNVNDLGQYFVFTHRLSRHNML